MEAVSVHVMIGMDQPRLLAAVQKLCLRVSLTGQAGTPLGIANSHLPLLPMQAAASCCHHKPGYDDAGIWCLFRPPVLFL